MSQAQELRRLGLFSGYAVRANFSPRQMQAFRDARAAGICAAVAYDMAKKERQG